MNRRVAVAAALVVAALGVGIMRTVSHAGQDAEAPSTPATTAPTLAASPPPALSSSSSTSTPLSTSPAQPVNQGAGEQSSSAGDGRDTGPTGSADDDTDRRYWEPVAAGFGRAFTTLNRGDTTDRWRARLAPYVTTAVDKQLATVDVANVPTGRFHGLDVLESSDEQISVQASYTPGWALVLYLISDGNHHWKVYRYDRLEQ